MKELLPRPYAVKCLLSKVHKMTKRFCRVHLIAVYMADRDPRTVQHFRDVVPLIESAIAELQYIADRIRIGTGTWRQ